MAKFYLFIIFIYLSYSWCRENNSYLNKRIKYKVISSKRTSLNERPKIFEGFSFIETRNDSLYEIDCFNKYNSYDSCYHHEPFIYKRKNKKIFLEFMKEKKTIKMEKYSLNYNDTIYAINEFGGVLSMKSVYSTYVKDTAIKIIDHDEQCYVFKICRFPSFNSHTVCTLFLEKKSLVPMRIIFQGYTSNGKRIDDFESWDIVEVSKLD